MPVTTVLYNDQEASLPDAVWDDQGLWVSARDLPRVNGFELKPEGACLGELCIPLRGKPGILTGEGDAARVNVFAFADLVQQAAVHDEKARVVSLGPVPAARARFADDHIAPDFLLNDRLGEPVSLSKFPDKKVILMTWASW